MRDFRFKAIEFETAGEAIQHTEAPGGKAIRVRSASHWWLNPPGATLR